MGDARAQAAQLELHEFPPQVQDRHASFPNQKSFAGKARGMQNLKICKEAFAERNEMVDDMATLEAEGIQGAAQEAPQIMYTLYYDFTPCDSDDPLLLYTTGPEAKALTPRTLEGDGAE